MTRPVPRATEAGFTLVEMMVVLAILVGVASVATVGLRPAANVRVAASTTTAVVTLLKLARIDAIQNGRRSNVTFDVTARMMGRDGTPPVAIAKGATLSVETAREAGGSGLSVIAFLPDGRSSGGRVDIGAGGEHRSITVDWLTGLIREEHHGATR